MPPRRSRPRRRSCPWPPASTPRNADELLADADLVIDGTDDILTRYVADDAAARAGIPLVWGSAAKFSGQVGVSWDGARGLVPRPVPRAAADAGLSCEVDGILPTVCTVTGGMMAGEALKLLTGVGEPLLGRVVVYDALSGRTPRDRLPTGDLRVEERPQGASSPTPQGGLETPLRGSRRSEPALRAATRRLEPAPQAPGEIDAASRSPRELELAKRPRCSSTSANPGRPPSPPSPARR